MVEALNMDLSALLQMSNADERQMLAWLLQDSLPIAASSPTPSRDVPASISGPPVLHVVLDSRNIAKCGSSLDLPRLPNKQQLARAFEFFVSHQPLETVWLFLYRDLAEKWRACEPLAKYSQQWVVTPTGEDVDVFLINFVETREQEGHAAVIVSNDLFRNHVRSSRITDAWVRQHTLKFTFTQSGDFLCPLYTPAASREPGTPSTQTAASSCHTVRPSSGCMSGNRRGRVKNAFVTQLHASQEFLGSRTTVCVCASLLRIDEMKAQVTT
ncbi:exo1 [Symbiodinium sp. CCMP2592]|nr:exo1 [Symbiodinium sp. CCMP2592]